MWDAPHTAKVERLDDLDELIQQTPPGPSAAKLKAYQLSEMRLSSSGGAQARGSPKGVVGLSK